MHLSTAKDFERHLADALDVSRGELDQRVRPLRARGLIPKGGRGLHAPLITPESAAFMILACVSRRAVDALEVATNAAELVPFEVEAFAGERTLRGVLARFLSAPYPHPDLGKIQQIFIDPEGDFALISLSSGQQVRWLSATSDTDFRDVEHIPAFGLISGAFGWWFVIGRRALMLLAADHGLWGEVKWVRADGTPADV